MPLNSADVDRVSDAVRVLVELDSGHLSDDDVLALQESTGRLGRLVTSLQARVAGEVARRSGPDVRGGGLAKKAGFRNPQELIAKSTGGSKAGARRLVEAGSAFQPSQGERPASTDVDALGDADLTEAPPPAPRPRFAVLAAAQVAGDLSVESAGYIAGGLRTLDEHVSPEQIEAFEKRWVRRAVKQTATEVRRMVDAGVARACQAALEKREQQRYEARFVAWREEPDGMVTLTARLDPVSAAPVKTVIEQIVTSDFRARRNEDPSVVDQRTVGQMRADALVALCRHSLGCQETRSSGVRTTIVVRMNLADLESGTGVGEIDGATQPVSVSELRRLAGDAEILPEVLSGAGEVLDLGRKTRLFTAAQRLALLERDGGCARCHAPPEHCEAHHIRWWGRDKGTTDLRNGVMLCTSCHHDIHRYGWRIEVRAGRVWFHPPQRGNGPPPDPVLGGKDAYLFDRGELPQRPVYSPWSTEHVADGNWGRDLDHDDLALWDELGAWEEMWARDERGACDAAGQRDRQEASNEPKRVTGSPAPLWTPDEIDAFAATLEREKRVRREPPAWLTTVLDTDDSRRPPQHDMAVV